MTQGVFFTCVILCFEMQVIELMNVAYVHLLFVELSFVEVLSKEIFKPFIKLNCLKITIIKSKFPKQMLDVFVSLIIQANIRECIPSNSDLSLSTDGSAYSLRD